MMRKWGVAGLWVMAATVLSGCPGVGTGPSADVRAIAGAVKFAAACGVLCSLIWAGALVFRETVRQKRMGRREDD